VTGDMKPDRRRRKEERKINKWGKKKKIRQNGFLCDLRDFCHQEEQ
jgi:hypothetical protein